VACPLNESPSKRSRACYEDEDDIVDGEDDDSAMQVVEGEPDKIAASGDARPVKPLRRPLTKSVSLPTGLLFTSQPTKHLDGLGNVKVEMIEEH
jgi:hypothetical protein